MAYLGSPAAPKATVVDNNAVSTSAIQNEAVTAGKMAATLDLSSKTVTLPASAVPTFAAGTVMLFGQTAAPTGWTKDTTNYNNSSLRVVTGTASTGGTVDFTTAFASQTPAGTVSVTVGAGTLGVGIGTLAVGSTTLTTTQIPSHNHNTTLYEDGGSQTGKTYNRNETVAYTTGGQLNTASSGGGGSHNHGLTGSPTISGSPSVTAASFSGSAINLAVKYVDVIRATKD